MRAQVDILQHREAQVKQAEGRAAALQQQAERLAAELAASSAEAARLKVGGRQQQQQQGLHEACRRGHVSHPCRCAGVIAHAHAQESASSQAEQLSDAAGLLADKERLEDAVRQQHALIEARGQELRAAKAQVEAKEAALDKARCAARVLHAGFLDMWAGRGSCCTRLCCLFRCSRGSPATVLCCLRGVSCRAQIDELSLRCKGTTALRVLLGQPFLVATSYARLRGALPCDREFNSLTCSAGGKLVLLGGTPGKGHADGAGREVSVLSTDTLT